MIKRLRLRMTAMVIAVLVLVSAGIVLATHLANERNIAAQAEETLSALAESPGASDFRKETPPPKPDEDDDGNRFGRKNDRRGDGGQPPKSAADGTPRQPD